MGFFQERLIFFPETLSEDKDLSFTGGEEVFLTADDGARIHGLFFEASVDEPSGAVLYLHGNAGSVASWYPVADDLLRLGLDVFLLDYRTYGKSQGSLSEEGLYQDGQAAYEYLIDRGYQPGQIVVYGRSLGAAVATKVAVTRPVGGVVLETPFTSLVDLAKELYPFFFPGLFLKYELDNLERAPQIEAPTLVIHGTDDEIIPLDHGRAVFEALPRGHRLVTIDGGRHNNLREYPAHAAGLADFFEALDGPDN